MLSSHCRDTTHTSPLSRQEALLGCGFQGEALLSPVYGTNWAFHWDKLVYADLHVTAVSIHDMPDETTLAVLTYCLVSACQSASLHPYCRFIWYFSWTLIDVCDWKTKRLCFYYKETESEVIARGGNTNALSLCSCGTFHVFNFIVTYLSLLQFAPWMVGRPHSGCWGHKGDNGSPLGLWRWKRHTAAGVLPRLQHWFYTVVLFHTGWINGKETKGQVSLFFPLSWGLFFGS